MKTKVVDVNHRQSLLIQGGLEIPSSMSVSKSSAHAIPSILIKLHLQSLLRVLYSVPSPMSHLC